MLEGETHTFIREESRLPPPQGIYRYECESYLKQPLTLPQLKIFVAYHISNHRLAIEIGLTLSLEIQDSSTLLLQCN